MSEPETEDGTENADEIVFYPDPPIRVDFKDLKKVNPDVVAWIYIGCIDASYPVLQGTDNTYYLHHTTEGEYNFAFTQEAFVTQNFVCGCMKRSQGIAFVPWYSAS